MIARRVERLLSRHGLALGAPDADARDALAEDAPALAALCAASVSGRSVLGRAVNARVARMGSDPDAHTPKPESPWHARHASFDLHAGRTVRADDRAGLERLCHHRRPRSARQVSCRRARPPRPTRRRRKPQPSRASRRYLAWAELLRRIFAIDVLACPGCGGRLRFVATIEDPPIVERNLRHLGLPTATPTLAPARPPPVGSELSFDFPT